jgi:5-formyltetrahydrofolate cyclo-ligase
MKLRGLKTMVDKTAMRKRLVQERLDLPDRLQRAEQLQRAMRIWLVGRPDVVIGAYWPIKGEFDPLPALYRWQEDGGLSLGAGAASPPSQAVGASVDDKSKIIPVDTAQAAINFISNLTNPAGAGNMQPSATVRKIGLPVVDKVHKTLTFYAWYPGCPMEEDAYNIPKPKNTEIVVPTLLFVPCVGFGPGGYRLGYGGGFYDRTLATLSPKPVTVGLAYSNATVPSFEPEPHDVPLAAILTDEGQAFP